MLSLIAIVGAVFLSIGLQRLLAPKEAEAPTSLAAIAQKEKGADLSAFSGLNPAGGLLERLDYWLAITMKQDEKLEEIYTMLGQPKDKHPLKMLHEKEMMAALLAGLFYAGSGSIFIGLFGLIGFVLPDSTWRSAIKARQENILRNFPTLVDLAALTIESGLDYMTAFDRILRVSKERTALEAEIEKTLSEVSLGYSRREALTRFAGRTGLQEIRSFVGLIVQSDELGTSLVDLLRNFGADMRFRRLQRAEKLAAQASTKMLIPLFIFIFPCVFILMLSPMIKSLLVGGLGF